MNENKIIALWTAPRSTSTAMAKSFAQRSDTISIHEPFNNCYYFSKDRQTDIYGDNISAWKYTGQKACELILNQTSEIVFFKEMAYIANPYVNNNFLTQITNVFLIREPLLILRSLRKIRPDYTPHYFGIQSLYALWQRVRDLKQKIVIIDAEHLRAEPERILRELCARIEIDFDPACLTWKPGHIRQWEPYEELSHKRWHKELAQTRGFLPPDSHHLPPQIGEFSPAELELLNDSYRVYDEFKSYAITLAKV